MINIADVKAINDISVEVKDANFAKFVESLDKAIKDGLVKARETQASVNAARVRKEMGIKDPIIQPKVAPVPVAAPVAAPTRAWMPPKEDKENEIK